MSNLKEVAARTVEYWSNKIDTDLNQKKPDYANIFNSVQHLRQGLTHLGLSADALPSTINPEGIKALVEKARETLRGLVQ